MPSAILPSETLDRKILDYVLTLTERARSWWSQEVEGTSLLRKDEFLEYRLRMEGRRSVAELYHDAKTEPFDGASNIGVGIEAIFSEFLLPLFLANTHDLEPMLQATRRGTLHVLEDLTAFHDTYHRFEVPEKRVLLEYSTRELLTVGSCFHKWNYGRCWRQTELDLPVWLHPLSGQPILHFDQGTGRMVPLPADPKMPKAVWPIDPATGIALKVGTLKAVTPHLLREGPELSIRPVESITFPEKEIRPDPNFWDWLADDFEVSPYWLLGREGEPFHGKLKLEGLWKWLAIDPQALYKDPVKLSQTLKPVKLRAFHGKYPAAVDGTPVEIVALIAPEARLNLGWRPAPGPRRPYFNRQVWHSGTCPLGKGIPETLFSLRSAMDALLDQDLDSGNLYNHPPLLLSDMAMLEDEDYETTGPGTTWIMRDIGGAKFLPTPISQRNPVELLNWLIANAMRLWGVSDLMLNAPTNALTTTPRTARGTRDVLTTGSIKFGHLTKRLSATDTTEYQYVHDTFRMMLANPKLVPQAGQSVHLEPSQRETYFAEDAQLAAVGNGISTNPILRQQTYSQFLLEAARMQNPFLVGDLEVYKQLTDQWAASYGIDVTTKDPQVLSQTKLFLELMKTPLGHELIPKAMHTVIQHLQSVSQPGGPQPNGRPSLVPAAAPAL